MDEFPSFVEAVIFEPDTRKVSVYHPLVINDGAQVGLVLKHFIYDGCVFDVCLMCA